MVKLGRYSHVPAALANYLSNRYKAGRNLHDRIEVQAKCQTPHSTTRCTSSMQPTLHSNAPFSMQMLQIPPLILRNVPLSQIAVASCCHHARLPLPCPSSAHSPLHPYDLCHLSSPCRSSCPRPSSPSLCGLIPLSAARPCAVGVSYRVP